MGPDEQRPPADPVLVEALAIIHALVDGEPTQADVDRLEELVRADRSVCRLYLRYMQVHRTLPRFVAAQELIQQASRSGEDLGSAMILPALRPDDAPSAPPMPATQTEVDRTPSVPEAPLRIPAPRRAGNVRLRWAAAILLPLALVIGLLVARSGRPKDRPTRLASSVTLESVLHATWGDAAAAAVGRALPEDPVQLKSGMVELQTATGVTVIVSGPAEFQVRSAALIELRSGSLTAMVPPAGHGFTVHTPTATVVDLGTEFGVSVADNGQTHVDVFRGTVQATGVGEPARPVTLHGGEATDISTTTGVAAPIDGNAKPHLFVRTDEFAARQRADDGTPYGRWLEYSYQLRHDPSLALYYPCESATGDRVLRNAAMATEGRYDVADAPWGRGRWPGKRGLQFENRKVNGRPLVAPCPMAPAGTMTVAAWVNARSRPFWASIAKNRGDFKTGQFSMGLRAASGDLFVRVFAANGDAIEVHRGAAYPLPLGQWVLVAMVVDGRTASLYQDGALVAALPCGPVTAQPDVQTMSIGFVTGDDGRTPTTRPTKELWDGSIDELAVFHRPLAAAEIRHMYEAGKPN